MSGHLAPLPVLLRIPLEKAWDLKGEVRTGDVSAPVKVEIKSVGGQNWAEVTLSLMGRAILTLTP